MVYLEIGTRAADDSGEYSDIDMTFTLDGQGRYFRKDGTPYPPQARK